MSNGTTANNSSSIKFGIPSEGVKGDNRPVINSNTAVIFAVIMYIFLLFIVYV